MSIKKLTKAQQVAEPKKRKKLTVEENDPKAAKKAEKDAAPQKKTAVSLTKRRDAAFPLRYAFAAGCGIVLLVFLSVFLNDGGLVPHFIVSVFTGLFGQKAFYISLPTLVFLIWLQLGSTGKRVRGRSFAAIAFVLVLGSLFHLIMNHKITVTGWDHIVALYSSGQSGLTGGVICGLLTDLLAKAFGRFFITITLLILGAICLVMAFKLDLIAKFKKFNSFMMVRIQEIKENNRLPEEDEDDDYEDEPPTFFDKMMDKAANARAERKERKAQAAIAAPQDTEQLLQRMPAEGGFELIEEVADFEDPVDEDEGPELLFDPTAGTEPAAAPMPKDKVTAKDAAIAAGQVEQEIAATESVPRPEYCFPPLELLKLPKGRAADGTAEMRENTRRLNETLASFKIEAHISNVTRGPSVTRYEVELEKGVRLNKLTSCADDIALSLGASGVRIAPVPGKISVVGIEVPNQSVTTVSLRDVIGSDEFGSASSHSSIAVGKDIGGKCIIGNIAKFPHMLIAGTTGSGKSVCMNSIIISLLYKAGPEDVKLIMVDPKMVELGIYNGIPHLLIPVVTDPKKAAGSLQWAVTEMMRRYRSMSDAGVRDLESYNSMIEGEEIEGVKLPQIVVIIDELADLMLVAAKEVEESICRIAQMGRAAGIHLIIATQRPSADVITGLMKANIPSRIAFAVASAMESRIILDTVGAEKLVGKGDMLYSPIGSGKPQRVQGCFVTDTEVEAVANYVKEHFASTYDQAVIDDIDRKAEQTGSKGGSHPTASDPDPCADELAHDEMLPDAVDVILETNQASVSLLQRRLKLGYARAARIVDEMEEMGIVGPFVGSKPRQILVTKDQWEQMKQGQTIVTQPDEPVPDDIDIPF